MYKIAVLGDKDSVLGFKALGLEAVPVETAEQAKAALHRMAKEDYAVIYLTETFAADMSAEIEHYKDELKPGHHSDSRPAGLAWHRKGQSAQGRRTGGRRRYPISAARFPVKGAAPPKRNIIKGRSSRLNCRWP